MVRPVRDSSPPPESRAGPGTASLRAPMTFYARSTRSWLDQRFARRGPSGAFFAHMPIYGFGHPETEGHHTGRLARSLRILRALDGLAFTSLLDVGGAEGYLCHVVRSLFGTDVATSDLSVEACWRARELFGLPAAAVDCARLPFPDGAFDVVVCSEVLEHVEQPVPTMLELCRVARCAVVLTTEEIRYDRASIDEYLFRRPGWPHMERNVFHPDDLVACLPGAELVPQCDVLPPDSLPSPDAAIAWLLANTRSSTMEPGRIGVAATIPRAGITRRARTMDDATLLARLFATTISPGTKAPPRSTAADAAFWSRLVEPTTLAPLRRDGESLVGARTFPIRDAVPDFVDVDAPTIPRDELERRLGNEPPGRRRALLDLHDRLELPERWTQDAFDFAVREHRRGFWPNDQLVVREGADGFRWRATGGDPWIVTPLLQRPIRAVEIEMRIHAPGHAIDAGTAQLFWKGADQETFVEACSVTWRSVNDGRVHRYRIDLAGRPGLPAEVQWLRIDPVDGPCEVDLVSLRIE